ncbi:CaiB/BaiF CoA transferase family protein [Pseudooceanicola aestuarii]|uniref:CaiB/BaiF CoA transferase family protein n=1 Tax=Pseudooceanicola aestuarii TaxID=2697319 RepID=UPI0013D12986|nr:CoA transferase [Pseudooceanicola aestuarii]
MFKPLEGVKVLDLTQVLAGPYATYQLALMGAEIIKIEKPGEGDWTRIGGPRPELAAQKMALGYLAHNACKKSVTLDLKTPDGLELARKLIAECDVFVENFKPGVAERLGLGLDAVRAVRPDIVYCSISAYGQDGPMRTRPAYDHVIQGMCGIMLTTGRPGDGPTKVGAPYIDYATGLNAATAIMAALMEVRRTGQGVHVDVAMLDTALAMMASLMTNHLSAGWVPEQNGNEAWSQSPSSGAFETADGILMLAANHAVQFRNMAQAIGRADLLQDPRWSTPESAKENAAALRATLEAVFLTRPAAEWEDVLSAAAVPAARIRRLDEVMAEDQVRARALISEMRVEGVADPVHVPAMTFKANGINTAPSQPPARLGADTDAVLGELGVPADRLAQLRAGGVI